MMALQDQWTDWFVIGNDVVFALRYMPRWKNQNLSVIGWILQTCKITNFGFEF